MTTIIQMNQEDLRNEFKNQSRELLEEFKKMFVPQTPIENDEVFLKEACEITKLSSSKIYKLSMNNEIPVSYYGKRLVFSRKALIEWMETRTVSKKSVQDPVSQSMAKAAKKHLEKC